MSGSHSIRIARAGAMAGLGASGTAKAAAKAAGICGHAEKTGNVRPKVQARIDKAVAIAEKEYSNGVHETSENDSSRIRQYKYGMANNWSWCSYFANYCYGRGQGDSRVLFGIDKDKVGRSQTVKKYAQENGYFSNANAGYTPRVGDLAVWTNKKSRGEGHIGIVVEVHSDGSFVTIEGNKDDKVSKINYSSQAHSETDTKTNRFAGFVRMSDYLTDLENGKISATLSPDDEPADIYEREDIPQDIDFLT